uniref:THUMP domain-containing protein n=1 Tax=Quercus lobata TaxID=97700 RepID=A0A7N2L7K3_QUELO
MAEEEGFEKAHHHEEEEEEEGEEEKKKKKKETMMSPWEQHSTVISIPRYDYNAPSSLLHHSLSGFLITCTIKREKSATKEAISILDKYVGSCSNADSGNLDNSDDNAATKRRKICPEDDQDGETETASNNSGKTSGTCLSSVMPDTNLDRGHVLSLVKLTRSGLLLFTFPRNTPADTVGVVSNIMESVESGISKSPLWCHRIFPIQETCSLNEKELQIVVSKLVFQFMNDKQHKVSHPVKFLVGDVSQQLHLFSGIMWGVVMNFSESFFLSYKKMQPTNKPLLTSTCTDTTVLSISALLYASCSSGNGLNEMCWSSFKNHIFDVKSYYKAFSGGLREVLPWQVTFKRARSSFLIAMFAVGYNRRGIEETELKIVKDTSNGSDKFALLDRNKCFGVVAAAVKSAVSDSVVDLKSPEFSVLVELLPLSGVPNGSLVVAVSVLPQNLVNTKPRLCIKALVSDSKAKGGKHKKGMDNVV